MQSAELTASDGSAHLNLFLYKGHFGSFSITVPGPLEMKDHSKAVANQMRHNKIQVQLCFDNQKQIPASFFVTRLPWDEATPVIFQNDHGIALYNQSLLSKTLSISLVDDSDKTYVAHFDLSSMPAEMAAHNVAFKKEHHAGGWIAAIIEAGGVL
ncbi:MAG: hypothetical protein WBY53_06955 [Acidobacteriaceae bacterium]